MVSFWPFGREDANSPKSFEKALAALSDKIQRLQVRDDTLRATHRRVKVLFTLYGSFIYILVFLILTLVTGYEKWNTTEWTAIAASPVAILVIRYLLDLYFDWREGSVRTRLERATRERDRIIKKLKDAMRYDSTKELLDKYGGSDAKKEAMLKQQNVTNRKIPGKNQPQQAQRTGFAPPPTANIPSRVPPVQIAPEAQARGANAGQPIQPQGRPSTSHDQSPLQPSESFAPNAFDYPPPQVNTAAASQPPRAGFLDRMLDLIVGEDESAARNRIVLLCTSCRTVNGQAPPGTRSLAELGRWRCGTCGAWNGFESETEKLIKGTRSRANTEPSSPVDRAVNRESSGESEAALKDVDDTEIDLQSTPAASTRNKSGQSLDT